MRKQSMIETRLVCPKCGNIETIYRKEGKQKEYGHLKYFWCYKCKKRINHLEICREEIQEAKDEI